MRSGRDVLLAMAGFIAFMGLFTDPGRAQLAVRVENHSVPEACAEKDNIDLRFLNPEVRSFRVQAVHPAYIGMLREDLAPPDFTDCDMSGDPVHNPGKPRQVTLYETPGLWIVGQVYPSFWRPADVPVEVAGRRETGLHLVQVFQRVNQRWEEMLVVYPPDGYWRARPLPPRHMSWTAYGSSFMVGPVQREGRPVVAFREIRFEPETLTFRFSFRAGGGGALKIAALDSEHIALDVSLEGDLPRGAAFAALRSMYVSEVNNDAARVIWREKGVMRRGEAAILDFKGAEADDIMIGRSVPSRHNLSAPDMLFSRFRR